VLTLASLLWLICQVAFSWWTTTKGCDWRSAACSPRPDSRSPRLNSAQNCSVSTLTTSRLHRLDHDMPGLTGLERSGRLRQTSRCPSSSSPGTRMPLSVAAMKAGAVDFLTKPVEADRLIEAVVRGLSRSRLIAAQRLERRAFLDRVALLTSREREVAALVIQGLLNKQIAATIGTAEKTVKVHRARLMENLGVTSVAELARLAERNQTLALDAQSGASAAG
jgi:FixJ family two-component response regulator